jgi:hypothetical protein
MKHMVLGLAAGIGMIAGTITSAQAAPLEPGTPGTRNCRGQTEAYMAQFGKGTEFPGVGGYAKLSGLPTHTLQELVDAYCTAG